MLRRATACLFLCAAALALVLPAAAGAHAAYKESDPADESTVESAPSEIWAEFTEPPSEASYLEVHDPCGERVDGEDSRPDGYRLYVSMSGETAGEYRVTFFVNSEVDNHNTRGEFTFTAVDGSDCPGSESQPNERAAGSGGGRGGSGERGPASAQAPAPGTGSSTDDEVRAGSRSRQRVPGPASRKEERGRGNDVVAQAPSPRPGPPDEPSPFSGIPWGAFLAGLGMSAVIGAAGGLIYAGIMGYARR